MAEKKLSSVLVYSPHWPVGQALCHLCVPAKKNQADPENVGAEIIYRQGEVLAKINEVNPDILVMDIPLRMNCGLMSLIRHYYPSLPVMIVQSRFLFSDRVVAEYFSHVWLKEYDVLLAGYPALPLQAHLSHPAFAGAECGGSSDYRLVSQCVENTENIRREMDARLRLRLYDLLKSPRLCEVVMDWLAAGATPMEVGASLSRSAKVVYHYRGQVMRALNITRCARDFIPSVTVKMKQDERGV